MSNTSNTSNTTSLSFWMEAWQQSLSHLCGEISCFRLFLHASSEAPHRHGILIHIESFWKLAFEHVWTCLNRSEQIPDQTLKTKVCRSWLGMLGPIRPKKRNQKNIGDISVRPYYGTISVPCRPSNFALRLVFQQLPTLDEVDTVDKKLTKSMDNLGIS